MEVFAVACSSLSASLPNSVCKRGTKTLVCFQYDFVQSTLLDYHKGIQLSLVTTESSVVTDSVRLTTLRPVTRKNCNSSIGKC